jgi:hypothetical protein
MVYFIAALSPLLPLNTEMASTSSQHLGGMQRSQHIFTAPGAVELAAEFAAGALCLLGLRGA